MVSHRWVIGKRLLISISVVVALVLVAVIGIGSFWSGVQGQEFLPYVPNFHNTIYTVMYM